MSTVIGVDIGKNKLNYCVLDDLGEILDENVLDNDQIGYDTIFQESVKYLV